MLIKNFLVIFSILSCFGVSFASENLDTTPKKIRPECDERTPGSSARKKDKAESVLLYNTDRMPEAFNRIVSYYESTEEEKANQLKLLAAELWCDSNVRSPSTILTGSLALSFWFCKYHDEQECHDFLEERNPEDIDILVDSLAYTDHLIPSDYGKSAKVSSEEKYIRYKHEDSSFFGYDIISMAFNGLPFGSVSDLRRSKSGDYIPVLGVKKLLERKKLSREEKKATSKSDISNLTNLFKLANEEKLSSDERIEESNQNDEHLESPAKLPRSLNYFENLRSFCEDDTQDHQPRLKRRKLEMKKCQDHHSSISSLFK